MIHFGDRDVFGIFIFSYVKLSSFSYVSSSLDDGGKTRIRLDVYILGLEL